MSVVGSRTRRALRRATVAAVSAVCLTAGACAHHEPTSGLTTRAGLGAITSKELRTVDDRDAYTAIALLRPNFLTNRGQTSILLDSPNQPDVFIDGMYYGPFDSLRQIPFLNVGDATIRYGTGHPSGIIDMTSLH